MFVVRGRARFRASCVLVNVSVCCVPWVCCCSFVGGVGDVRVIVRIVCLCLRLYTAVVVVSRPFSLRTLEARDSSTTQIRAQAQQHSSFLELRGVT